MGRGASSLVPSISFTAAGTGKAVDRLKECGENDLANECRGGGCALPLQLLSGDAHSASALPGKDLAGAASCCRAGRDRRVDGTKVAPPSDMKYPVTAPTAVS